MCSGWRLPRLVLTSLLKGQRRSQRIRAVLIDERGDIGSEGCLRDAANNDVVSGVRDGLIDLAKQRGLSVRKVWNAILFSPSPDIETLFPRQSAAKGVRNVGLGGAQDVDAVAALVFERRADRGAFVHTGEDGD